MIMVMDICRDHGDHGDGTFAVIMVMGHLS